MKIANALIAVLSIVLGSLSFVPTAAARDVTVCADDVYNQGYSECYGVLDGCGAAGVGHSYDYHGSSQNPPAGQSGQWCFLYVTTGSGSIVAVCSETEYHVYDDCIVTLG